MNSAMTNNLENQFNDEAYDNDNQRLLSRQVNERTEAEIANWVQVEFGKATLGANNKERTANQEVRIVDISILNKLEAYLTCADDSNYVRLIYGLTMVPSEHLMENNKEVIAFFDKRRQEVPSTQYVSPEQAMDTHVVRIPSLQDIADARQISQQVQYLPQKQAWQQVIVPTLAPFPIEWADYMITQKLTPIELAFKINKHITAWSDENKTKIKPLVNWILGACVRRNENAEDEGPPVKLNWRPFLYTKDSTFKWASDRLNHVIAPWKIANSEPAVGRLEAAFTQIAQAIAQQAAILSMHRGRAVSISPTETEPESLDMDQKAASLDENNASLTARDEDQETESESLPETVLSDQELITKNETIVDDTVVNMNQEAAPLDENNSSLIVQDVENNSIVHTQETITQQSFDLMEDEPIIATTVFTSQPVSRHDNNPDSDDDSSTSSSSSNSSSDSSDDKSVTERNDDNSLGNDTTEPIEIEVRNDKEQCNENATSTSVAAAENSASSVTFNGQGNNETTSMSDAQAANPKKKLKLSTPKSMNNKAKSKNTNHVPLLSLTNPTQFSTDTTSAGSLAAQEVTLSASVEPSGTNVEIANENTSAKPAEVSNTTSNSTKKAPSSPKTKRKIKSSADLKSPSFKGSKLSQEQILEIRHEFEQLECNKTNKDDLKLICKKLGILIIGTKQEVIDRLRLYFELNEKEFDSTNSNVSATCGSGKGSEGDEKKTAKASSETKKTAKASSESKKASKKIKKRKATDAAEEIPISV